MRRARGSMVRPVAAVMIKSSPAMGTSKSNEVVGVGLESEWLVFHRHGGDEEVKGEAEGFDEESVRIDGEAGRAGDDKVVGRDVRASDR